jgi:Replication initiator protein A
MAKFKVTIGNEIKPLQQEIKKINEKLAGVKLLQPAKGTLDETLVRMQSGQSTHEKTQKKAMTAKARKEFIEAINHATKRAYKELPQFFKFCLFKNNPRRFLVRGKVSEFIEPVKEPINFRGLVGEVTYFYGELGDTDRMIYLAIINEAIRHKEFVKEFGRIPFSIDEIADKAGLADSGRRYEIVEESLYRLQTTNLLFKNGTGGKHFKERFHLIEHYTSIEKSEIKGEVNERLGELEGEQNRASATDDSVPYLMVTYFKTLQGQAEELLAKFKPRTHQLTLITFNKHLMDAINGDEITTVDMWALQRLTRNSARSLYLYLYDVSQWRDSTAPLEISLVELMQLMDLTPNTHTKDGVEYTWWKRSIEQVKDYLEEVNQVAQFIEHFEWIGEGEQSILCVQLCKDVLQISRF